MFQLSKLDKSCKEINNRLHFNFHVMVERLRLVAIAAMHFSSQEVVTRIKIKLFSVPIIFRRSRKRESILKSASLVLYFSAELYLMPGRQEKELRDDLYRLIDGVVIPDRCSSIFSNLFTIDNALCYSQLNVRALFSTFTRILESSSAAETMT